MAKAKARSQPPPPREPARRSDGEQWANRFIIGGFVAVVLLVGGVIAFGWWFTQIRPLDKTVLRVENTEFNVRHLQRRVNLSATLFNTNILQSFSGVDFVNLVLSRLEREAKLLEAADELDISVTDEEVDAEIIRLGNLSQGADSGVFAAELRRQVDESGLKLNEFLQMIRADLLDVKAGDQFAEGAPESGPQVRARWFLTARDNGDLAQSMLERLRAGEDFDALDAELADVSSTEIDFSPRFPGQFPSSDVEEFLFSAQVDEFSEVIQTSTSLYVVQLLEREDDRELNESQRQAFGSQELNAWLLDLNSRLTIERNIDIEDAARALSDLIPGDG